MNTRKLITLSTASLTLALFINACGSSNTTTTSSSSSNLSSTISSSSIETISSSVSSFSSSSEALEAQERIDVVDCSNVSDDALIKIEVGDILINEELNTSIKLIHNEEDTKFACLLSGSAYLIR